MQLNIHDDKLMNLLNNITKSDDNIIIFGCCDDCSRKMARWMAGKYLEDKGKKMFVINNGNPLGIMDIYRDRNVTELRIGYDINLVEATKKAIESCSDCIMIKVPESDKGEKYNLFDSLAASGIKIIDIKEKVNSCSLDGKINSLESVGIPECMKFGIYTSCSTGIQEIVLFENNSIRTIYSAEAGYDENYKF